VSMDFVTLQAGIEAWLTTLVGTDPKGAQVPVRELEAPQQMAPNRVWCSYKIGTSQEVGRDFTVYDLDESLPSGEDNVPHQWAQRRFTLEISVESHNQTPGWAARNFLERVRTRLTRPSSLKALRALNVSILGHEPLANADRTNAERSMSKAVLDVHMGHALIEADTSGATGVIETVEVESTFKSAIPEDRVQEHTFELTE
jgi:hypothetical protein